MPCQTVKSAGLQYHLTAHHHTVLEYSVALLWMWSRWHCLQWQCILWTVIFAAKLWHHARDHSWTSVHFSFPIFGALFAKLRRAKSFVMFVRMEQLGSHWTDLHDIWYLSIFRKSVWKILVSLKSDKNNGTLHEDQRTLLIISRSVLFRMEAVSNISCGFSWNLIFEHFSKICLEILV